MGGEEKICISETDQLPPGQGEGKRKNLDRNKNQYSTVQYSTLHYFDGSRARVRAGRVNQAYNERQGSPILVLTCVHEKVKLLPGAGAMHAATPLWKVGVNWVYWRTMLVDDVKSLLSGPKVTGV